jgi:hypothetical protein
LCCLFFCLLAIVLSVLLLLAIVLSVFLRFAWFWLFLWYLQTLLNMYISTPLKVRFMVSNAIYNNFQIYHGHQFICGGSRSIRRKSPTCSKSLTSFIT